MLRNSLLASRPDSSQSSPWQPNRRPSPSEITGQPCGSSWEKSAATAKKTGPAFLIVPQGGVGLLTDKGKPIADEYLKAIDAIGQEEIFYGFDNKDNRKTPKKETERSSSNWRS